MGLLSRIANLWRRDALDADIAEELQSHLDMAAEEAEREGHSRESARRLARRRFGNVGAIRERTTEADTSPALENVVRDFRLALRRLRRSPVFTCAAVVTLALGIGATTAVFTLVEQVMLRALPVSHPEELYRVGTAVRCCYSTGFTQTDWTFYSADAYGHLRAGTPGFASLAAQQVGQAELAVRRSGASTPAEPRVGQYVSSNFFETLGVPAWRGRLFTNADDRAGAALVAVMSFHAWTEKYGADPSVIGATFALNGQLFTIVGVTPPGFFGAKVASSGMPDLWMPLSTEPVVAGPTSRLADPTVGWLNLIGRVRPEVDPKLVESQAQVALRQWLTSRVGDMSPLELSAIERQTLHLAPGANGIPLLQSQYESGLKVLFLAAISVLFVACANIGNLLLARGLKERPLTALRTALGASRGRMVRQSLAESVTLSVIGGVVGIAVAFIGTKLILGLAFTDDKWVPISASPSVAMLSFAIGVAVVTGIAFGIAPAFMTSRADPIDALRGASRAVRGGRHWIQSALVTAQAAVSLVLLSTAAMLGSSLRNLEHGDFGFDPRGRYLVALNAKIANRPPEQLMSLATNMETRLRAIPGVRAASPVLYAPMSRLHWSHRVHAQGVGEAASADWTRVTPSFFETIGDRILLGRGFTAADNARSRRVAVVNQAFAKRFFANDNPIGKRFGPGSEKNAGTYEIIGVAADVGFFANLSDGVDPMYFVPQSQSTVFDEAEVQGREVWSHYPYNVVLWAPVSPRNLEAQVKAAIAEVDPDVIVSVVWPYQQVIHAAYAPQSMIATLASLFGVIGLVLAAVGLYGVTAYGVEQRTSEIGVRMALGADRRSVLAMVLRGAFVQLAAGLAIGIPAAIGAGRLLSSQLVGVTPYDVALLLMASVLLGSATLIAAVVPARRAANIAPVTALRAE